MNPLIVEDSRLDEWILRKERVASQKPVMTAADIEKVRRFRKRK